MDHFEILSQYTTIGDQPQAIMRGVCDLDLCNETRIDGELIGKILRGIKR